ncbi:hypothetical protein [Methylobacterium oxalidis]|uniref:Uncharacterized protein n=1 Tax=Methylobacterium oxalidis TaxID=944322 RepID=A0A512JAL5_9HYPH|nr:hypothetical protein [Methylobacterium oxalidis]GEP06996.1 hypothetical protein MOX02_50340 [Methylobacterium oxalidis]GJE32403.1 hypothetical protein LDDCCGHA_2589 [Methylobacterium oxalidis]GLS63197.1 hypothetical protein GCM10007888_15780 [Methylobacterium oxalidis]
MPESAGGITGRSNSRTWRTPLRLAIRFGLPLVGVFVIGRAVAASIGGNIERGQFALGILLIALGFASRLVSGR